MIITTQEQLLEFIRKQSLKLLKESQAPADLEEKLADVDEMFVQVNQKRLDKLNSAEESAMSKEDYSELHKIKQEKVAVLKKLIDSYKYKTKILEEIYEGLSSELKELGVQGSNVFKDKTISKFNNEDFEKGNTLKITTLSADLTIEKISENNQYKVLNSNIENTIAPGDIVAIPSMQVGSSAQITVYREKDGRYETIGTPMLKNITTITKNPS